MYRLVNRKERQQTQYDIGKSTINQKGKLNEEEPSLNNELIFVSMQ